MTKLESLAAGPRSECHDSSPGILHQTINQSADQPSINQINLSL